MSGDRGPLGFGDERDAQDDLAPAHEPAPFTPPPPAPPPGSNRYTWFVGVVAFLLIALAIVNSIGSGGVPSGGPDGGDRLVPFAVPLAAAPSRPDEDANVDRDTACRVRGPGVLNMCELAERGPVVFALFPTGGAPCRAVLDQFAQLAPQFEDEGVTFVGVGGRGERSDLTERRWPFPVGWDKDGAVASVYGLVGCPQISFAERGGAVVETTRRELTDAELTDKVRELVR